LNFAGDVQNVQTSVVPRVFGRSYAIEADVMVPESGAEGVLLAFGDFIGGYALWVDEKRMLHHTYQFLGIDTYKQTSTEPIPTGDVTLKMLFEIDEPKPGAGGKVTLWANDKQIGEGRIPQTVSLLYSTYAGLDVGRDNGGRSISPTKARRHTRFPGTVRKVVFDLKPAHPEAGAGPAPTRESDCRRRDRRACSILVEGRHARHQPWEEMSCYNGPPDDGCWLRRPRRLGFALVLLIMMNKSRKPSSAYSTNRDAGGE